MVVGIFAPLILSIIDWVFTFMFIQFIQKF